MRHKKNITLNLRSITSHFTEKKKIITLSLIIIMLNFTNITLSLSDTFYNSNVSALSYQSSAEIKFTFNPTLSINISSSDLVIDNLTPGTTSDSNIVNVSVATNASHGYTLSATVGDSLHNNTNLTHTNGTNTFDSIATNSSLPNLTTDNTWGYSYKLSNNTNWNNYSGLSNEASKTLINTNSQAAKPIDFKIAAKASDTQPSGTYTGVINFTAVTKHIPVTLAEAYASEGKTMVNGFYTMQDITTTICSKVEAIGAQLQVLDKRDNKLYWISKLADNKCWMTKNLNLAGGTALSADTTDVTSAYIDSFSTSNNLTKNDDSIVLPASTTAGFNTNNYSYVYNSGNSTDTCANSRACYSYYSWDAATLGSGRSIDTENTDAPYSICPKGWKLPASRTTSATNWQAESDFYALAHQYGLDSTTSTSEGDNGFYMQAGPGTVPNFLLAGRYYDGSLYNGGNYGYYWSSTSYSDSAIAWDLRFNSSDVNSTDHSNRRNGFAVRCLAR